MLSVHPLFTCDKSYGAAGAGLQLGWDGAFR